MQVVLTTHKHIHAGKNMFLISVGRHFNSVASSLTKHTHLHTGEKPYVLNVGRQLVIQVISQDKRIHTGEKPHVCN